MHATSLSYNQACLETPKKCQKSYARAGIPMKTPLDKFIDTGIFPMVPVRPIDFIG